MSTVFKQVQLLEVPPFNELSYELREKHVKNFLSQLNVETVRNRSQIPCIPSNIAISQNIVVNSCIYDKV